MGGYTVMESITVITSQTVSVSVVGVSVSTAVVTSIVVGSSLGFSLSLWVLNLNNCSFALNVLAETVMIVFV